MLVVCPVCRLLVLVCRLLVVVDECKSCRVQSSFFFFEGRGGFGVNLCLRCVGAALSDPCPTGAGI